MSAFDPKAFGDSIRKRRETEQVSLRWLAEHLGICASTLSRVENGKSPDVEGYVVLLNWLKSPRKVKCEHCNGRGWIKENQAGEGEG